MVSQDRLVVTRYHDANFTNFDTEEYFLSSLNTTPEILFEFPEGTPKVTIAFYSDTYDLYVETPFEKEWDPRMKGMHHVTKNREYVISESNNELCPQVYRLIFAIGSRRLFKSYEVLPLQAIDTKKSYEEMKAVISDYSSSLLFDEGKKRYVNSLEYRRTSKVLRAVCSGLIDNYNAIKASFNRIKKNPILNLTKVVAETKKYGKQNEKAIIKSMQTQYQKYYGISTSIDYDCLENRTLKFYLHKSATLLTLIAGKVQKLIKYSENSIAGKQRVVNRLTPKLGTQPRNSRGIAGKLDRLNSEIDMLNDRISFYKRSYDVITSLFNECNDMEYDSFLNDIPSYKGTLNNKFLKNNSYSVIYNSLYLTLLGVNTNGDRYGEDGIGYSYKSTSDLYEVYCLFVIVEALQDLGFEISETEDGGNLLDLDVIDGDLELFFDSEKYSCKLIFDKEIPAYDSIGSDESGLVVINAKNSHNKPDYQLQFFDDEGELSYCMILDAKCRKFINIDVDMPGIPNEAIKEIVLQYIQFRYRDSGSHVLSHGGVNDLAIIYPESTDSFDKMDKMIGVHYLSFTPSKKYKEQDSYAAFKKLLNEKLKLDQSL